MFKLSSIKEMIGYGATGIVKIYENFRDKDIAIKIVDMANNRNGFEQAKHEVAIYETLRQLQGDCIPKIEFVWECYPFFIFGMTLIKKLGDHVRYMSMDGKKNVMIQLKMILDKIHDVKVTHNDLRFENIIVDNDKKVWLIDFGQAVADSNLDQIDDDEWQMNLLLKELNISPSTLQERQ